MEMIKKISIWASTHKNKSQILIVLFQVALIALGLFYSSILLENEINISKKLLIVPFIIFLISIILYPFISLRKKKISFIYSYTYNKQKLFDFIISLNIFFIVVFSSNYNNLNIPFVSNAFAEEINLKSLENIPTIKSVPIDKKKKNRKRKTKFIIITALVLSVAVILGAFVAGFACGLSCSGYTTSALLVLITGWLGVLIGLSFSVRALIKHYFKKNKDNDIEQEPPFSKDKKKNRWKIFWITAKTLVVSALTLFLSFLIYDLLFIK